MKKYFLQSKIWTSLYIVTLILNYILILFSVLFYRGGALILYPMLLMSQGILAVINCLISRKIYQFTILSLNLLISTIIANIVFSQLYSKNICGGSEAELFYRYALTFGCIYVDIISVLAILLKKIISKYMN